VGWCGDSRAYRFNPAFGLQQLSHDHSYVQELVDTGRLLEELAFDHPESNIITRSLGDNRQKARPDVKCYPIYNEDIILLCSDGLNGVLRDNEIQSILLKNTDSMESCRKALWAESEIAGWIDNVTIILCQIMSGANEPQKDVQNPGLEPKKKKKWQKSLLITILVVLLLGGAFEVGHYFVMKDWWNPFSSSFDQSEGEATEPEIPIDIIPEEEPTEIPEENKILASPDKPEVNSKNIEPIPTSGDIEPKNPDPEVSLPKDDEKKPKIIPTPIPEDTPKEESQPK